MKQPGLIAYTKKKNPKNRVYVFDFIAANCLKLIHFTFSAFYFFCKSEGARLLNYTLLKFFARKVF